MSRNKAAAVSAFRLLLRPSTAPRNRNLLALRLAPVTTFALVSPINTLLSKCSFGVSTGASKSRSGGAAVIVVLESIKKYTHLLFTCEYKGVSYLRTLAGKIIGFGYNLAF